MITSKEQELSNEKASNNTKIIMHDETRKQLEEKESKKQVRVDTNNI